MHRVDDRRIGPCLECIAELERQHEEPAVDEKQDELFPK
jgi:hypothetical protein